MTREAKKITPDAINKKEGESQYLADLKQIRKAYAPDVKEIYPNNSISQNSEMSTPTAKKSHAFSEEETKTIQNSFANAKKIGSLILGSLPKSNVARIYTQPIKRSIADFLQSVKTLPLTNEVFSADVAQELLGEAAVKDNNRNLEYYAVRFVVAERINQPLYLYDIIDIKKETSSSLSQSWITKMDKNSSRSLNNSIPQNSEMSTPMAKKVPLSAKRKQICFSKQWKTVG